MSDHSDSDTMRDDASVTETAVDDGATGSTVANSFLSPEALAIQTRREERRHRLEAERLADEADQAELERVTQLANRAEENRVSALTTVRDEFFPAMTTLASYFQDATSITSVQDFMHYPLGSGFSLSDRIDNDQAPEVQGAYQTLNDVSNGLATITGLASRREKIVNDQVSEINELRSKLSAAEERISELESDLEDAVTRWQSWKDRYQSEVIPSSRQRSSQGSSSRFSSGHLEHLRSRGGGS